MHVKNVIFFIHFQWVERSYISSYWNTLFALPRENVYKLLCQWTFFTSAPGVLGLQFIWPNFDLLKV